MRRLMLTAFFLLIPSLAQALAACANDAEREAMAMRALQSEFMMAAVACNQASAYNSFITRYQKTLSAEGRVLKGYFAREYGPAEKHVNDFVTELANAWSQVHLKDMRGFCQSAWDRMWYANNQPTDRAGLIAQARERAGVPVVSEALCPGAAKVLTAKREPQKRK